MKKIILLHIFVISCFAKGFFLGGSLGANIYEREINANSLFQTTKNYAMTFGIKGGYQDFIQPKHGFRTYLDLEYGFAPFGLTKNDKTTTQTQDTKASLINQFFNSTINLDYLYSILANENNSFNLYAGIFMGVMVNINGDEKQDVTATVNSTTTTTSTTIYGNTITSYTAGFNFGVDFNITKQHTIQAGIKFLGINGIFNGSNILTQIGYLYHF